MEVAIKVHSQVSSLVNTIVSIAIAQEGSARVDESCMSCDLKP
jgi:hypothetical protein